MQASCCWQTAEIAISVLICLNCTERLIPAIDTIAASLFLLSADSPSAISYLQQCPIDIVKPQFFDIQQAAETGFCASKSKFPLNLNMKRQQFIPKGEPFD
jgi:hypothetical protein